MPKKRPLETRIAEHEKKLDELRVEKQIRDLKATVVSGRRKRRRN